MRKTALAFMLFIATAGVAGASQTETFDRTVNLQPGGTVELDNVNGKIRISAWDQRRSGFTPEEDSETRATRRLGPPQAAPDRHPPVGSTLASRPSRRRMTATISSTSLRNHVNASVEYELTVPRSINLNVDNTNGSITATELSGEIDVETTNGRIDVVRCSGSVDAETTNGGINVELVQVRSGRPMRFETTNGGSTSAFPSNVAADIDASTTNGRIDSEIPITTTRSEADPARIAERRWNGDHVADHERRNLDPPDKRSSSALKKGRRQKEKQKRTSAFCIQPSASALKGRATTSRCRRSTRSRLIPHQQVQLESFTALRFHVPVHEEVS